MSELEDSFYALRDLRTVQCAGHSFRYDAVHIVVDGSVGTPVGQACLLATVNQLARAVPHLSVDLPPGPHALATWSLFDGDDLEDALQRTVHAIDPFSELAFTSARLPDVPSLGLGPTVPRTLTWYVGFEGAIATLDRYPQPATTDFLGSLRGAALASCLAVNALLRTILALPTIPVRLSTWNYLEGATAAAGPITLAPVDVGRVLLVGAGAVASSFVYWLRLFGVGGTWDIVDRDNVALDNTNRSMLFSAMHAGWPDCAPVAKALILASHLPGATPHRSWYHECEEIRDRVYDVLLCVANDYDVRTRSVARGVPVTLHATTGEWLSELHRHVVGRDDCIRCRTADIRAPRMTCSTAPVPTRLGSRDAALPFLSASSGLMLATALQRLHGGVLTGTAENDWRWYFDSANRMTSRGRRGCTEGCTAVLAPSVRRRLGTKAGRWARLDPANE